jgi:hypothetical protein
VNIENPVARATTLSALEALRDLGQEEGIQRAIAFDSITAEAAWLLDDDGDVARQLGIVLYAEEEVGPLRELRAALHDLYDLLDRDASWEEVVDHPHFPFVMTAAGHAVDAMRRYEPRSGTVRC